MGFFGRYVEAKIQEALIRTFRERGKIAPPEGFCAAEQFRGCAEEWVIVPFGGAPALMKLRVLGAGEFPEVTLLEFINEGGKMDAFAAKVNFRNTLEHYCRHALVEPSFQFFEEEVWGGQSAVKEMRAKLAALKKRAEMYELAEAENKTLEELELSLGYCLPLDAMRAIAGWCECLDMTDTKRLTKEDLTVAYSLSRHYHNRASDNLRGSFLSHTRKEVDLAAAKAWHDKYGRKEI
jgi:hypothetical protein